MPRLTWKTSALCEGRCVSGRKRAAVDGEGAGEVNRGQVVRGQVKELGRYFKEQGSHGKVSMVRFVFLKDRLEWCAK